MIEDLFEANGWADTWRDGIYDYVHYHSRINEALGVARGKGRVRFGGKNGRIFALKAGDVGSGTAFNRDRNGGIAGELVQRAVRKCRPAWSRIQAPESPRRRGRAQESRFAGAMTNDDEFYRRQAREAEEQAQRARSDLDRQAWLRIARDWLGLLRRRPQSDDDSKPEK